MVIQKRFYLSALLVHINNMAAENPHFSVGHFCGGCPVAGRLHTGCVTDGSLRINVRSKIEAHVSLVESDFIGDCDRDGIGGGDQVLAKDPAADVASSG